jgi:hypothetical protein
MTMLLMGAGGPGVSHQSQVDTLSFSVTPAKGSYTLTLLGSNTTGSLNWNDDLPTIQAAVDVAIGAGQCTVSFTDSSSLAGGLTFTYGGGLANQPLPGATADVSTLFGQGTIGATSVRIMGAASSGGTQATVTITFDSSNMGDGSTYIHDGNLTIDGDSRSVGTDASLFGNPNWTFSGYVGGTITGTSKTNTASAPTPSIDFNGLNDDMGAKWADNGGVMNVDLVQGTDDPTPAVAQQWNIPWADADGGTYNLATGENNADIPFGDTGTAINASALNAQISASVVGSGPGQLVATYDTAGVTTDTLTTDGRSLTKTITATPATPMPGR